MRIGTWQSLWPDAYASELSAHRAAFLEGLRKALRK